MNYYEQLLLLLLFKCIPYLFVWVCLCWIDENQRPQADSFRISKDFCALFIFSFCVCLQFQRLLRSKLALCICMFLVLFLFYLVSWRLITHTVGLCMFCSAFVFFCFRWSNRKNERLNLNLIGVVSMSVHHGFGLQLKQTNYISFDAVTKFDFKLWSCSVSNAYRRKLKSFIPTKILTCMHVTITISTQLKCI